MDGPQVSEHEGVYVVRDDLYPGGTKARFLRPWMAEEDKRAYKEFVYASPCEGGAQTSLCVVARETDRKATIFVAQRGEKHPRIILDKKLGGKVIEVPHGYLNVVQAAATKYAVKKKAFLMPFGFDSDEAVHAIANVAVDVNLALKNIDQVWCASGSGTLARALAMAFPDAKRHVVQIGRTLTKKEVAGATIHVYPKPFGYALREATPFPSDPHYDAKAWAVLKSKKRKGNILFWNVMGPPDGQA